MKIKSFASALIGLILCSACGIKKYTSTMTSLTTTEVKNVVYSEKEIEQDIDYFIKSVEEVSPFPYMKTDSGSIQSLALAKKKKGDRTGKELYLDFMELAAAYNVGHIYTFPPEQMLDEAIRNGDRFFPVFLKLNHGKWEILGIMSNALPDDFVGNEVKKINGIPVDDIIKKFLPLFDDEREQTIGASMPFLVWAADIKGPFSVEIVNKNTGVASVVAVEGSNDLAKYRNKRQDDGQQKLDDFITFEIRDNDTGYINAKSFYFAQSKTVSKAFTKKLDSYFNELQEKGISNLIIDLRENGGGSGFPAESILQRIANKPYQQSGGSTMRVSAQFRDFIADLPRILRMFVKRGQMKDYDKHPVGTNIESETKPTMPKKAKNKFSGQVYVLIGPGTHSAAMMMANAVEDFDLGILVGEPTVSIPRELSNGLPMKTPNARISFIVPATLFTRANGDATNYQPVKPDVVVETTAEDIKNGQDPVMQYVVGKITNEKRKRK
ncbi:MAG: S41 family peptidase [Cytophagales bacterium]|jgi:C-terminal processing protease CtpA/Prc|nr:S41 family peptidase [Cytophagales bacterium]MCA6387067.1 S41 family peptidase [Cytophagales bacterium]MCA6389815.1 S41 family peptidase [Cytophagales bacterium]MCA6400614.1 S41 family peptidase [Cytophagales bacterium]MCA6406095.1 S41 family peptidase [Cytophagales bacterium]